MAREVHGAGVTARAPGRCRARTRASSPGVSAVNDARSVMVLQGRLNWRPFRLEGPGLAADRRRADFGANGESHQQNGTWPRGVV